MENNTIFKKKRPGDLIIVAKMLGLTSGNVSKILKRTSSKRHNKVIEALKKVIENRESLITDK